MLRITAEIIDLGIKRVLTATVTFLNRMAALGNNQSLTNAALVISGGGGTTGKVGAATWYGFANSILVSLAAAAALPALAGTVTNAAFNVFVFTVDSAGTVSVAMGTEGVTLAAVVFPGLVADQTIIGFVIINPTGTGNFVGGTTALDDGTVVPNHVFVNATGSFDVTSTPEVRA